MKFDVSVRRYAVFTDKVITLEADTVEEAMEMALEQAPNEEYTAHESNYEVESCKRKFSNVEEIKDAVSQGYTVYWKSAAYEVRYWKPEFNIVCVSNGYAVGLTDTRGEMKEDAEDFFAFY
jgi:hypothetical protein